MWQVTVKDTCVGSGMCAAIAGRFFRLGEDEQSRPLSPEIAPDDAVRDAMAACPMEAIVVTEARTGELIDP
jgi:ferredoxin